MKIKFSKYKLIIIFIALIIFDIFLLGVFNSRAAIHTPSNMDPGDVVEIHHPKGFIEDYEEYLDDTEMEVFSDLDLDDASISDRSMSEFIKDIFLTALYEVIPQEPEEEEPDEDEPEIDIAEYRLMNENTYNLLSENRDSIEQNYKNVVVYTGSFNDYDVKLIIPYEDYHKLDIIDGILVNLSNSAVTGKFLYDGDSIGLTEYDSYIYVLNPIYGNTSNVYNYGSFNYRRHYYLSSNNPPRITSTDTYGYMLVDDVEVHYSSSERIFYVLLIFMLIFEVGFLWIRRH